jgi:hypothetical protein
VAARRRLGDRVLHQRRLADAGLAPQHQASAVPRARTVEEPVQGLALALTSEQSHDQHPSSGWVDDPVNDGSDCDGNATLGFRMPLHTP